MRASGAQLRELTALIDSGAIRPVVERVFPFEGTNDAMAFVEAGARRARSSSRSKSGAGRPDDSQGHHPSPTAQDSARR
jgi:alcohol dehydrogenase